MERELRYTGLASLLGLLPLAAVVAIPGSDKRDKDLRKKSRGEIEDVYLRKKEKPNENLEKDGNTNPNEK